MTEAAMEHPDEQALADAASRAALRAIDPAAEENAGVRATGHRTLELLQVKDATGQVSALLVGTDQDPSHWVRAAAASTLGALGGPAAIEALRKALLQDRAQDVRAAAARELGELEDRSAETTERLIEALRDEAGVVRLNARRALREIHGADLGLDPRTWRGWIRARGLHEAAQEPLEPEEAYPEEAPDDAPAEASPPGDEPLPEESAPEHPLVEPAPGDEDDRR
jgi:HEAT repeat protein